MRFCWYEVMAFSQLRSFGWEKNAMLSFERDDSM